MCVPIWMVSFFYGGWMLQQSQRPQLLLSSWLWELTTFRFGLGAEAIAPTAHCRIKYRKNTHTLTHRIQHAQYVCMCAFSNQITVVITNDANRLTT